MYHRLGHMDKIFVKKGDKVKKGQKIATIGTGNGQYSAHLHYDIPTKEIPWTSYVFKMSLEQVKKLYADPKDYRMIVMPSFNHFGFEYLEHANYGTASKPKWCFHPGEDLNGKGAGNSDLGAELFSPCDGEVVYCYNEKGNNSGWGKLLVIKETEESEEESFGIDLSHHNKVLDWDKVKADFIYIKCTQGTTFLDSKFKEYRDAVRKKGIKLGFYHFAGKMNDAGQIIPQDPIKEADWFLSNLDIRDDEDLILDWEVEHKDQVSWCRVFIERVKEKTGKTCIFYTNEARALKYPFPKEWIWWIAKYGTNDGTKQTEPRCQWDIWQYTSRGKVAGIEGFVDLNQQKEVEKSSTEPKIEDKNSLANLDLQQTNEPTITTEDKKDTVPVGEPETLGETPELRQNEKIVVSGEAVEPSTTATYPAGTMGVSEPIITNENNMETIKNFFQQKQVKTFFWNVLGTFLGIVAIYLTDIQSEYAIVIVPAILALTKYINKTYLT